MEAMIRVNQVEKTFESGSRQVQVLKGVHLELYARQWIIIRGRSGSGKTTLLNVIGGLDIPTRGEVYFQEELISLWNDLQRTKLR
jgi:putative ABC transport system ATP-binding protein